ncbi:hypothetical protein M5G27_26420 [Pseudomonas shahriarae]|jgi:hypothetical protein|uniref:Peptidase M50B-like n=1 Tax=Pseudomonas shahriarae TaxID=2745512 RepID=A0A9X4HCG3_9PSED|nr:hypothetical protein [Pseudomonas shahriarae]MDD1011010.1 hypothetical protein [Pseudomonas shahriarae]
MTKYLNLNLLFSDPVYYLVPSLLLGVFMAFQRRTWIAMKFLQFTGVLVHEMLHYIVGFVTMARPSSMSLVPRTDGGRLVLGSVGFVGLNWINAWITALAPLLALPIVYGLASWRLTQGPQHFQWVDILIWVAFAPQCLNCWPSRADWKLVLISWPLIGLLAASIVAWIWGHG